jgi:heme oxygenase (mycobilin-producing)
VLVVSRFTVDPGGGPAFAALARDALAALSARPGFRRGSAGPATDDPAQWVLVTEWDGVGAYRRALSAYEVKLAATPLLARARDEPGAFESLVEADPTGIVAVSASDRAADADTAVPGGNRAGLPPVPPAADPDTRPWGNP